MFGAFLNGINVKRLALTVVAVFAWIFASDYVIHELILGTKYAEIPQAFRPKEEMGNFMVWLFVGQFLIAKFFCVLFVHGYKGTGIMEGVRFGLYAGFLLAGCTFIQYAVFPLSCAIACSWVILGVLQCVIAGVIASKVYK